MQVIVIGQKKTTTGRSLDLSIKKYKEVCNNAVITYMWW